MLKLCARLEEHLQKYMCPQVLARARMLHSSLQQYCICYALLDNQVCITISLGDVASILAKGRDPLPNVTCSRYAAQIVRCCSGWTHQSGLYRVIQASSAAEQSPARVGGLISGSFSNNCCQMLLYMQLFLQQQMLSTWLN